MPTNTAPFSKRHLRLLGEPSEIASEIAPDFSTNDHHDQMPITTDSHGPSTTNTFDAMGRLTQKTVSVGGTSEPTTYEYDQRDRLASVTDALNRTTTFQYDPVRIIEKPSSITDPAGRVTHFEYDRRQRLVKKTEANGAVTSYTFDQRNNLTSVTDAQGVRTTYSYDLNDRKIREMRQSVAGSSAAQRETLYFYDSADHLVREVTKSATGGQDRSIVYEYNPLDRMVRRTVQREGASGPIVEDDSTFSYEDQLDTSLLKTAVNSVANLGFSNEAAPPFAGSGFSVAASQSGNPLGLIEGSFDITRDVTGEIASVSKDGTYIFEKSYDPAGRMLSGSLPGGSSTFGYDGFGRRESIVHPGNSGSFQRDLLNRVTQVTWTGATPISQAMGFDLAGNITTLERENTAASTIAYDAVDQVLSSAGGSTEVRSYTRDLMGNRLQDSQNGAGSFISNFLASNGVASYTADPNGFGETVQEVKAGVTKNYVYRADGLLSGFQSSSTQVASYYDALGRLAARAINDGTNTFTQSYAYVGDESTLLQAKAGDGTITSYLSGQDLNDYLAESKGGVYKGYLTDHAGSILNSELAGPAHRYSLHGEPTGSATLSPTSSPAMLGWQGLRYNPESGNWDNLAREYNPSLGSFRSQDALGIDEALNLYSSRENNPLLTLDPDGFAPTNKVPGGGGTPVPPHAWNAGKAFFKWLKEQFQKTPKISPRDAKSIRSLEKRIDEHLEKLNKYKENPMACDNKGHLKNAPNPQKVIDTRIKHLEDEIENFQNWIQRIKDKK